MTSTDASATVLLVHSSPLGTLAIPTPDGRLFVAEPGVPVALPADVAGVEPGEWETLPDGAAPDLDDGRTWQLVDGGAWQVREPGFGLLAQVDVWRRADVPAVAQVAPKKSKED
jgi:hypothetical protein